MNDLDRAAGTMPAGPGALPAPPFGRRRRGRPKGSRNKARLALEAIVDDAAEELMRKAIAKALAGDPAAMRFCLTRLLPVRRERPVRFDLPPIESAGDLAKASGAVLSACAAGTLTPSEAKAFMNLIDTCRANFKAAARLAALRARLEACEANAARAHAAERASRCGTAVFNSAPAPAPAPAPATYDGQRTTDGRKAPSSTLGRPSLLVRHRCRSAVFYSDRTTRRSSRPPRHSRRRRPLHIFVADPPTAGNCAENQGWTRALIVANNGRKKGTLQEWDKKRSSKLRISPRNLPALSPSTRSRCASSAGRSMP